MKHYYIVYSYSKGSVQGKSTCDVSLSKKLNNMKEIEEVKKMIKEDGEYDAVVIENWKRIRGE